MKNSEQLSFFVRCAVLPEILSLNCMLAQPGPGALTKRDFDVLCRSISGKLDAFSVLINFEISKLPEETFRDKIGQDNSEEFTVGLRFAYIEFKKLFNELARFYSDFIIKCDFLDDLLDQPDVVMRRSPDSDSGTESPCGDENQSPTIREDITLIELKPQASVAVPFNMSSQSGVMLMVRAQGYLNKMMSEFKAGVCDICVLAEDLCQIKINLSVMTNNFRLAKLDGFHQLFHELNNTIHILYSIVSKRATPIRVDRLIAQREQELALSAMTGAVCQLWQPIAPAASSRGLGEMENGKVSGRFIAGPNN